MKFKDKKFDLFGTEYSLEYVDKIEAEEGLFSLGKTNSAANAIQIARKGYNGQPIDSKEHRITLLHELLHAILDEGQYLNSSSDEPMVEWLARCLVSLIDQKVI